jgi:hypothetical protein
LVPEAQDLIENPVSVVSGTRELMLVALRACLKISGFPPTTETPSHTWCLKSASSHDKSESTQGRGEDR